MRLKDIITMRKNKCDKDRRNPSFSDFWRGYHEGWYHAYRDIEEILEQKGLEVEFVVRCKDCRHRVERGMCYMISGCPELVGVGDNFWCAYGERKDGDGNG